MVLRACFARSSWVHIDKAMIGCRECSANISSTRYLSRPDLPHSTSGEMTPCPIFFSGNSPTREWFVTPNCAGFHKEDLFAARGEFGAGNVATEWSRSSAAASLYEGRP